MNPIPKARYSDKYSLKWWLWGKKTELGTSSWQAGPLLKQPAAQPPYVQLRWEATNTLVFFFAPTFTVCIRAQMQVPMFPLWCKSTRGDSFFFVWMCFFNITLRKEDLHCIHEKTGYKKSTLQTRGGSLAREKSCPIQFYFCLHVVYPLKVLQSTSCVYLYHALLALASPWSLRSTQEAAFTCGTSSQHVHKNVLREHVRGRGLSAGCPSRAPIV